MQTSVTGHAKTFYPSSHSHSIPDFRLLDWSRSAFIAAYFAAIEAAKWSAKSNEVRGGITRLAVWAFKATAYDLNMIASQSLPARVAKIREITLVTAPTASNPNLRAQRVSSLFVEKSTSSWTLQQIVNQWTVSLEALKRKMISTIH